jgi:hypothetical protein
MTTRNLLEDATNSIRETRLAPDVERQAAERVEAQLASALGRSEPAQQEPFRLETCEDFRSLMPGLLRDELSPGRRALLDDHVRSCIPCRRALRDLREGRPAAHVPVRQQASSPGRWLAIAAGIAAMSVVGWAGWAGLLSAPEVHAAQVRSIDGALLRVDGDRTPLRPGEWIAEHQVVRTTEGSLAVLQLADGSRIELGERSQLSVRERRNSLTVRVDRGDVIVEAAEQRKGELSVATDDLLASVKGTVFAVGHGAKGSRVAVLEGEVQVAAGREERLLAPGEQFFSSVRLAQLPLESAVSWSQDSERYLEQLREVRALREELSHVSLAADLRYSKRLLDLAPAGTAVYASVPNLGSSLQEVRSIVERRIEDSPALAEWWSLNVEKTGLAGSSEQVSELLQLVADELGDEIVFVAVPGSSDSSLAVAMVELRDPEGFENTLRAAIADVAGDEAGNFRVRFVVDPSVEASDTDEILLWIHDDLLVASAASAGLTAVSRGITTGGGFAGSALYEQLAQRYDEGIEMVAGVDVKSLIDLAGEETSAADAAVFEWQMAADLRFGAPRRGMVAWLSAPAPMGSLEFVSADATAASALLFKDPLEMVDEILAVLETMGPEAMQGLSEMESQLGLGLREDLAAPLGGEVAVALDGPALPSPAWKLVVEVVDEIRLQSSLEILVARLTEVLQTESPGAAVQLAASDVDGRTYYELTASGVEGEHSIVYSFADGYMVAAPSRVLVDRAMQTRASQYTLLDAPQLSRLMPVDSQLHFSGLAYQDVGSLLGPLAETASKLNSQLTPEQQQMVAELSADALAPSLVGVYGETDSIRVVGTTEGGLLGGAFDRLLGAGQMLEMGRMLQSVGSPTP